MIKHPVTIAVLLGALALASCGDPPELVARSEQQKAEIAKLRGEIALLEEKLRSLPADVSTQLDQAKKKEAAQKEEIEQLETEIADLQARKRELGKEFDVYRAKYQTH